MVTTIMMVVKWLPLLDFMVRVLINIIMFILVMMDFGI